MTALLTARQADGTPAHRDARASTSKAWSRALALTAPIVRQPDRLLLTVLSHIAARRPDAPALMSDGESFTYREVVERSNRYARWALEHLDKGETVCLLMRNRPEYMAIWLGVTSVGGVVSLLNTSLVGSSLAHSLAIVAPRHVIVAAELTNTLADTLRECPTPLTATIWVHGSSVDEFPRIDDDVASRSGEPIDPDERRRGTIDDVALQIYTSGTTGLPKAANVSHARLMQWSLWFAGMMDVQQHDRMYNCLPMHHSVGGVVATGAVLAAGGSVVIRDSFSARAFWDDVVRWDCTLIQYIGELCRYLLHSERHPRERAHRIRLCCGNGLMSDVWLDFKNRFAIPQILEFYAATEGNVSLFNLEEKVGSVGRIPSFLAHRSPVALVAFDADAQEARRNDEGFCIRCKTNEVGEAIGRVPNDRTNVGSRFDGYTSAGESEKKILRDVFERGDVWFRTGDLMRTDEHGYFYFVDRVGDTFRWKGENVSTFEVSAAIGCFPGVRQAIVYGVAVPGRDGRAGMAVLVADPAVDLAALRTHLGDRLPDYARPRFFRIVGELETTATFKYRKSDLVRQGCDPSLIADAVYFDDPEQRALVRLDAPLYARICGGTIRM